MDLETIHEVIGWRSAETTLRWSVRRSFTDYVGAISDSRIQTDGVILESESVFVFGGKPSTNSKALAYRGAVHFWAHFGVLDFRVADVVVALDDEPRITIAAQARETERATLATLSSVKQIADDAIELKPLLTQAGARLLGDVYEVGSPLDAMLITVKALGNDPPQH